MFMDETSNTPEELEDVKKHSIANPPPITNVVRLLRGVLTDDTQTTKTQIIGYFRGVGMQGSLGTKLTDRATGRGLSDQVIDAYRFIAHNLEWYSQHDPVVVDEIYLFGFSRGAYAARALAGFMHKVGLIRKGHLALLPIIFDGYQKVLCEGGSFGPRVDRFLTEIRHKEYASIPVKFIGVWDTVDALGIPVKPFSWVTQTYRTFHNTELCENVTHAAQALAIHELRAPFKPVFLDQVGVGCSLTPLHASPFFPGREEVLKRLKR